MLDTEAALAHDNGLATRRRASSALGQPAAPSTPSSKLSSALFCKTSISVRARESERVVGRAHAS